MSRHGAPEEGAFDASDYSVAVVAASWHEEVMTGLIAGAQRAIAAHGVTRHTLVRVPGSFELPVVVDALAERFDAVAALGVVIRGNTPHFDYVCQAATDGLSRVALDRRTAIGFGVLTCNTEQQALDRAGLEGSVEDKGWECVASALATARTLREITP